MVYNRSPQAGRFTLYTGRRMQRMRRTDDESLTSEYVVEQQCGSAAYTELTMASQSINIIQRGRWPRTVHSVHSQEMPQVALFSVPTCGMFTHVYAVTDKRASVYCWRIRTSSSAGTAINQQPGQSRGRNDPLHRSQVTHSHLLARSLYTPRRLHRHSIRNLHGTRSSIAPLWKFEWVSEWVVS